MKAHVYQKHKAEDNSLDLLVEGNWGRLWR